MARRELVPLKQEKAFSRVKNFKKEIQEFRTQFDRLKSERAEAVSFSLNLLTFPLKMKFGRTILANTGTMNYRSIQTIEANYLVGEAIPPPPQTTHTHTPNQPAPTPEISPPNNTIQVPPPLPPPQTTSKTRAPSTQPKTISTASATLRPAQTSNSTSSSTGGGPCYRTWASKRQC